MKITRRQLRQLILEADDRMLRTADSAEEGDIVYYQGDFDWEYKSEGGVWYTRKRDTDNSWIDLRGSKYSNTVSKLNSQYPQFSESQEEEGRVSSRGENYRDEKGNEILRFSVGRNPTILFFYPGWLKNKNAQQFVKREIEKIQSPENFIAVVAKNHYTPFRDMIASARSALGEDNNPGAFRLGGWSAGGAGLSFGQNSPLQFEKIIYADPSPKHPRGSLLDISSHGNAKMYYRPENWRGDYSGIGNTQRELAEKMGSQAIEVDRSHNQILVDSLEELLS